MNSKIELINEYIAKCDSCTKKDSDKFVRECISLFENEISNITEGLDIYNNEHMFDFLSSQTRNINCLDDVKLLKKKFLNYKASLEYDLEKSKNINSQTVNVHQSQNQSNQTSISISFDQTILDIEAIPNEKLSQDEKGLLVGKLTKLNTEKDKSKLWEKAQSVLKWIAEKGFEVGIAALPYIAEALKNAK